jgi:hypothetical protein
MVSLVQSSKNGVILLSVMGAPTLDLNIFLEVIDAHCVIELKIVMLSFLLEQPKLKGLISLDGSQMHYNCPIKFI